MNAIYCNHYDQTAHQKRLEFKGKRKFLKQEDDIILYLAKSSFKIRRH